MASAEVSSDIAQYVEGMLQERLQNKDLVVGNHSLIKDIKGALIQHADGIYVWSYPRFRPFAND